jgi:hypothetical protein
MVADLAIPREAIMNKLFAVMAVAGLCAASGFASASDKGLAAAWPGVSSSMARLVKASTWKSIAASIAPVVPGLSERRVEQSSFALDALFQPEGAGKVAEGTACPWCPDPPCM